MANPTAWAAAEWAQRLGQPTSVEDMRAQLLGYLAAMAAHGDMVVAEYLLLVLLSRVYNRSDVSMPFGHLSLNVIWPSMSATDFKALEQSLHALVPSCLSLDLSLAALHDALYFPQKVRRLRLHFARDLISIDRIMTLSTSTRDCCSCRTEARSSSTRPT